MDYRFLTSVGFTGFIVQVYNLDFRVKGFGVKGLHYKLRAYIIKG